MDNAIWVNNDDLMIWTHQASMNVKPMFIEIVRTLPRKVDKILEEAGQRLYSDEKLLVSMETAFKLDMAVDSVYELLKEIEFEVGLTVETDE